MPSCDLDVTKRNAGIERSHDERSPKHVRMDNPEASLLTYGTDPSVRRAPVEALTVVAVQDRTFTSLSDGEIRQEPQ